MSISKVGLKLTGDLTRKTVSFRCAEDMHTALRMAAREYDMKKSDIVRRILSNFLYYNLDSVDGIDDDAGIELLRAINVGKRDYDRAFNSDELLNNNEIKESVEIAKKSPVKKKAGSFDLTDLDNLH